MSTPGQKIVVIVAMVGLLVSPAMLAVEPRGFVRIIPSWIEAGETAGTSTGLAVLRVTLLPDIELENVLFQVQLPDSILIEPQGRFADRFRTGQASVGTTTLMISLGRLPVSELLALEFVPSGYEEQGGIVSFSIRAEDSSGRVVEEAIGVPLGHPGTRGVRRHGAIEFPAVSMPETSK